MVRYLLAGLIAVGAIVTALPDGVGQDKKAPPKKKERVAIADPQKAKADPDFAIQGEYVGEMAMSSGPKKVGAQVVAKGGGAFDVRLLTGGLPGDGWDQKAQFKGTGTRGEDGLTTISGKDLSGSITSGKMTVRTGTQIEATLKKVERQSKTLGQKPPAGAAVLFGKPGDETNWDNGKLVELSDGKFLNMGIKTKQKFNAFTAHIEFRTPWMPNSSGQGRGNSGVYLQDRYELQVLDSFGLSGENNECGGFYTLHKPLVNMCYPPLVWQTYDIEFTPAEFGPDGKKAKNARSTVYHNGVKIQDNVELKGATGGGQPEKPTPGPFQLQNHGDPLAYNNIWVVEKK